MKKVNNCEECSAISTKHTKDVKNVSRCVVYFTSWGISEVDLLRLSPKVTHLNLAFGLIDNNFETVGSDGILEYDEIKEPSDLYWINPAYVKWTQLKFKNPNIKVLLAYGGATYDYMWDKLNDASYIEQYAQALVKAANTKRPVFEKLQGNNQYSKVGYVALDGVDLDFEMSGRPTDAQLNNLAKVMTRFKELAPNKLITLTGYHVSADPLECQNGGSAASGCSFPSGSGHAGELILLLRQLNNENLDFYNLMAYDAGKNYDWKTAMNNHAQYISKSKAVLGLTLGSQWAPEGNFVEDLSDLIAKTQEQQNLGFGGIMVWAIGATGNNEDNNKNNQVDKINMLVNLLN